MKIFIAISLMLVTMIVHADSADLKVVLTGVSSDDGSLMLALVDSERAFISKKNDTEIFRGASLTIQKGRAEYVFKNLPYGEYAIKAFHDRNDNQRLDTNSIGIPTEGYGFSNNARGLFGPPNYSKARFVFDPETSMMTIEIR